MLFRTIQAKNWRKIGDFPSYRRKAFTERGLEEMVEMQDAFACICFTHGWLTASNRFSWLHWWLNCTVFVALYKIRLDGWLFIYLRPIEFDSKFDSYLYFLFKAFTNRKNSLPSMEAPFSTAMSMMSMHSPRNLKRSAFLTYLYSCICIRLIKKFHIYIFSIRTKDKRHHVAEPDLLAL